MAALLAGRWLTGAAFSRTRFMLSSGEIYLPYEAVGQHSHVVVGFCAVILKSGTHEPDTAQRAKGAVIFEFCFEKMECMLTGAVQCLFIKLAEMQLGIALPRFGVPSPENPVGT